MGAPSRRDSWEELFRYWKSKHVDGRPPSRAELDPLLEIPRFVKNLMVIDLIPGGFRYRLVGSEIVDRFGGELTGRRVGSSAMSENIRNEWQRLLELVRDDQKPRLMVGRQEGVDTNHLMLILPLVSAGGATERILVGAFFFERDFTPGFQSDGLEISDLPV